MNSFLKLAHPKLSGAQNDSFSQVTAVLNCVFWMKPKRLAPDPKNSGLRVSRTRICRGDELRGRRPARVKDCFLAELPLLAELPMPAFATAGTSGPAASSVRRPGCLPAVYPDLDHRIEEMGLTGRFSEKKSGQKSAGSFFRLLKQRFGFSAPLCCRLPLNRCRRACLCKGAKEPFLRHRFF